MNIKPAINKYSKKLNVSYARYLKFKRADRYSAPDDITFAEKHTARVAYLKKFILRLIILLTLLVVIWPIVSKNFITGQIEIKNENSIDGKKQEGVKNDLPVMLKPNFYGNDNNARPYNINADSGVSVDNNKTILSNIKANMALKDGSRIKIDSKKGDYKNKSKELILNDGVIINTESGYELRTNSAFIKLDENMATGSERVHITGKLGEIDASGFTIRDSGDEIELFGGIELITQAE